jgi:hypothetical protein
MVYYANHPDGGAHGGSAIIIKNSLRHHELDPYITDKIQSAKVKIQTSVWSITIAVIYSPPRHMISTQEYQHYFNALGSHFVGAGDWNAKHTNGGSITQKGKNLLDAIQQDDLRHLSTEEPTYWPADRNKIQDLVDFAIIKRISTIHCDIKSNFDLSSDHSPIIMTVSTEILLTEPVPRLYNKQTNWGKYQEIINQNIRLKEHDEIEAAVHDFTALLQKAAWKATPPHCPKATDTNLPLRIKELVQDKRRARRVWHCTRDPTDKRYLNRITHRLHATIQDFKNATFAYYIKNMEPNDHSLWRATKKFKRPTPTVSPLRQVEGSWARSNSEKAQIFAEHLSSTFAPLNNQAGEEINSYFHAPCQLSPPLRSITPAAGIEQIKLRNPHKAPGHDLIVGEILKHLPRKAIVLLTTL